MELLVAVAEGTTPGNVGAGFVAGITAVMVLILTAVAFGKKLLRGLRWLIREELEYVGLIRTRRMGETDAQWRARQWFNGSANLPDVLEHIDEKLDAQASRIAEIQRE